MVANRTMYGLKFKDSIGPNGLQVSCVELSWPRYLLHPERTAEALSGSEAIIVCNIL